MYVKPPSMKEINAKEKLFRGVSLFAGCGGSSTGHKMAGVNILIANEFVDIARETYEENHPGTKVIGTDIRRIDPKKMLQYMGLQRGELDLLDGSPPCKGFSTAGVAEKGWGKEVNYSGGKKQQVDDLFGEYIRMLEYLQPKVFTAENVSGLIKGASKGYFKETMEDFRKAGYVVRAVMMNAAWMGVPQSRERIIFMGVRNDVAKALGFKRGDVEAVPRVAPLDTICNLEDALPHIAKVKATIKGIITYVPAGNMPIRTITASDALRYETSCFGSAGFVEDLKGKRRKLTIDELKVISGMPHDFVLKGSFEQQWERLGRICVPQMTCAASTAFIEHVLKPYAKVRKKKVGEIFK